MGVRDSQTERLRVQAYRCTSGEQRIALAAMFEDGVAIARASILDRYPDIGADELRRQMRRRVLPRELARQVECYLQMREPRCPTIAVSPSPDDESSG